uniref:SREBP regulating gene protein n=1 Tax=Cacopsylla melanoneura TaxID=428564 RepID=A0A8D8Q302_9HEMI
MWALCVMCFLRRRLVLGLIFLFSLTYCILSFYIVSKKTNVMLRPPEDHMMIRRVKQFVWHDDTRNETASCRNSVQGKLIITDDRGYVCARELVQSNGCCSPSLSSLQYPCDTCSSEGCCVTFEYCVSCCLDPKKKELLENVLHVDSVTYHHKNILFASVTDPWELCLSTCRTSSASVRHENTYINSAAKFCYNRTTSTVPVGS